MSDKVTFVPPPPFTNIEVHGNRSASSSNGPMAKSGGNVFSRRGEGEVMGEVSSAPAYLVGSYDEGG
jgi:hypothetical protein